MKKVLGLLISGLIIGAAAAWFVWWPSFSGTRGAEAVEHPRDATPYRPEAIVWQAFLDMVVDDEGRVHYKTAQTAEARELLDRYLDQIARATPATFNDDTDRLAFYINAYNALVIHGVLRYWPMDSVGDAGSMHYFFRERAYTVAGQTISLHGLETRVIRQYDPRMHFALNCASESCPPLSAQAWFPETLDKQLYRATRNFIRNQAYNQYDPSTETWTLSKIFDWYQEDFGGQAGVLNLLQEHSPEDMPDNPTLEYHEYDWSLNRSREEKP